jgi:gliding motility-associated-like protein
MSELQNIDKLLKESFSDFAPDAPDVWQGISEGVQAAQAGQAAAGTGAAVKGGLGIAGKIIAAVAVSASLITGYVLLSDTKEDAAPAQVTTAYGEPAETTGTTAETTAGQEIPAETPAATPGQTTVRHQSTGTTHRYAATDRQATTSTEQPLSSTPDKAAGKTDIVPEQTTRTDPPSARQQHTRQTADAPSRTTAATPPVKPAQEPAAEDKKEPSPAATEDQFSLEDASPFVPNVFSPNGDGVNDRFVIVIEQETLYFLRIYDQKGNVLFESDNRQNTWDGRDRRTGMMCAQGMYIYEFTYQLKGASKPVVKRGGFKLY